MWLRVDLVWTDVSEERIASIFRVEKSAGEEPAWAGGCRHIPQDGILHSHRRENLKSYNVYILGNTDCIFLSWPLNDALSIKTKKVRL
jgi:hypothetical protein